MILQSGSLNHEQLNENLCQNEEVFFDIDIIIFCLLNLQKKYKHLQLLNIQGPSLLFQRFSH